MNEDHLQCGMRMQRDAARQHEVDRLNGIIHCVENRFFEKFQKLEEKIADLQKQIDLLKEKD